MRAQALSNQQSKLLIVDFGSLIWMKETRYQVLQATEVSQSLDEDEAV